MGNNKYILTDVSIEWMGKRLFQIKAIRSFWNIKENELWGYIEKETNLAQVYWNAWVYWDARVSAKKAFVKGWFIGWDDTEKITKMKKEDIGNTFWKCQYVLWDYEIKEIEEEIKEVSYTWKEVTVSIDGKDYKAVIQ